MGKKQETNTRGTGNSPLGTLTFFSSDLRRYNPPYVSLLVPIRLLHVWGISVFLVVAIAFDFFKLVGKLRS